MSDLDDITAPHGPQVYRDYEDFIERVARPMVEHEDDEDRMCEALAGFRTVSPYYLCVSLVMLQNRVKHLEAEKAAILAQVDQAVRLLRLAGDESAAQTVIAQAARWPEFVQERL